MKVLVACEGKVKEERACEARECPSFDLCKDLGWFWVPIEHEKPPRRDEYFIAYVFGDSDMHFYGAAMWHDDCPDNGYVKGDHFSNEGVDGMRVTHWARIPRITRPGGDIRYEKEGDYPSGPAGHLPSQGEARGKAAGHLPEASRGRLALREGEEGETDAVTVVRCRECAYREERMEGYLCWEFDATVKADDYCSHGVRKHG